MRRRLRPSALGAGSPERLVRPVQQVSFPGQLSGIGIPGGRPLKLGAQIAGAKEAAVRIDTFACAVDQGMTTDELGFLDLGYAPPFASVWDAIAIAANASK